jgi:glycosyl transferase family 11
MVVVRLIGGLGNQLFQYAAARAIGERSGARVALDVTGFETYDLHAFALHHFATRSRIASPRLVRRIRTPKRRSFAWVGEHLGILRRYSVVRERHFHFDPSILELRGAVYLDGYWQSEKYFTDVTPLIRRELTIPAPPDAENAELANRIRQSESVSVHIRRGDAGEAAQGYQINNRWWADWGVGWVTTVRGGVFGASAGL